MKILVLGATGTVDSDLVAELSHRALPALEATRDPAGGSLPSGPETPHGEGEGALGASSLGWTLLQPTLFIQNFATYSREIIWRDGACAYPAGGGRTAFVDVRDIAAVATEVLARREVQAGRPTSSRCLRPCGWTTWPH
jgi:uncharacterized protein YbjT (DUF2867 family)